MDERERRREAREAWRRVRDEIGEAFRRAWKEERFDDEGRRHESLEESVQNIVVRAKEFGREVGEETSRFGRDFADDARKQASDTWKGFREDWRERQQGQYNQGQRPDWQEHWLLGGRRFHHWAEGDEEANPLLAAMMSRGGGLLSLYALHLLAEHPRHGNDLMKEIERRTMGGWTSNPGAVYPLLSNMESNGFVLSNWEEPAKRTRRIYQITDGGREELDRLRQMLRPKLMDTIDVLHDIYDDLYNPGASEGPSGSGDTAEVVPASPSEAEGGVQSDPPSERRFSHFSSLIWNGARSLIDRIIGPSRRQAAQMGR